MDLVVGAVYGTYVAPVVVDWDVNEDLDLVVGCTWLCKDGERTGSDRWPTTPQFSDGERMGSDGRPAILVFLQLVQFSWLPVGRSPFRAQSTLKLLCVCRALPDPRGLHGPSQ